jgi:hypothetical protein
MKYRSDISLKLTSLEFMSLELTNYKPSNKGSSH